MATARGGVNEGRPSFKIILPVFCVCRKGVFDLWMQQRKKYIVSESEVLL